MNDQVSLICVCDKLPFSCSIQYNLNENSRLIEGAIMAQNLTYTQCGDYYIPDIRLAHTGTHPLSKYGRMRRAFLEQNKPMLFNDIVDQAMTGYNWVA